MNSSFDSQSFVGHGSKILDRLDRRVSRPVVPISSLAVADIRKRADTAAIALNFLTLAAIAATAAVKWQVPSLPESSSLLAAAFLCSGYMRPVRHKLVDWWLNRAGKDGPASIDQIFEVMTALETHPSLRPLVATAVASTGGKTLTAGNAKAVMDTAKKLPFPPRLPR